MKLTRLIKLQLFVALFGVLFAFTSVFIDFFNYYKSSNTVYLVDSTLPHPILTPCFYGAFAFLASFFLAFKIYKIKSVKVQKCLVFLSSFGTAFAWGNMVLEINKFLNAGGKSYAGCSGAIISNPFFTACFMGSSTFLILLIATIFTLTKIKTISEGNH